MKIAVCGKGGCGKSTVTSLLAKALARRGKEILVIDSDESNYGLHRQLGMKLPRDFTDYFGGKQNVLNDMTLSKFTHQFFEKTWTIDDIPEDYYSLKDGVKLMSSGKIHLANEGCSCAMGTVMTQFIQNLRLTEDQFALMDMEAGIEHFGRGIDNGVDLILIIIDPSYESLQLSKKIGELSESIRKPFYYVLNKVTKENKEMSELFAVEKLEMENEYTTFATQYDELQIQINNDSLREKLESEKLKTQRLLEELRQVKTSNAAEIMRLKKELKTVRAVLRTYVIQIDSLNKLNQALAEENQEVKQKYTQATRQINNLSQEKKI